MSSCRCKCCGLFDTGSRAWRIFGDDPRNRDAEQVDQVTSWRVSVDSQPGVLMLGGLLWPSGDPQQLRTWLYSSVTHLGLCVVYIAQMLCIKQCADGQECCQVCQDSYDVGLSCERQVMPEVLVQLLKWNLTHTRSCLFHCAINSHSCSSAKLRCSHESC